MTSPSARRNSAAVVLTSSRASQGPLARGQGLPEPELLLVLVGHSADRVADSEPRSSVPAVAPEDQSTTPGARTRDGLLSMGRRWRGSCSVCAQEPESGRRGALLDAGWALEAGTAVCPTCRQAGWQARPGGGVPFRPFSARPPGS